MSSTRQWQFEGIVRDSDDEDIDISDNPSESTDDLYQDLLFFAEDVSDDGLDSGSRESLNKTSEEHPLPSIENVENATPSDPKKINPQPIALQEQSTEQAHQVDEEENDLKVASSPLSSPPASPLDSTAHSHALPFADAAHDVEAINPSQSQLALVRDLYQTQEATEYPNRTLRHRNPIQVHPYAIEQKAYSAYLRRRGILPVRVRKEETDRIAIPRRNSNDISSKSSQYNPSSSPQAPFSSPPHTESNPSVPERSEDENSEVLPDLDTMLRHAQSKATRAGNKRRKIRKKPISNQERAQLGDLETTGRMSSSGSDSDVVRRPSRRVQHRDVTPFSASDTERFPTVISIPSPQSNPKSPELDDKEARHVRKRIRGVLPASWIRLDQHLPTLDKDIGKKDVRLNHSSVKSTTKGIARRVSRGGEDSRQRPPDSSLLAHVEALELSRESDEAPSSHADPAGTDSWLAEEHELSDWPQEYAESAVEVNFVDPMLPAQPRKRQTAYRSSRHRRDVVSEPRNDTVQGTNQRKFIEPDLRLLEKTESLTKPSNRRLRQKGFGTKKRSISLKPGKTRIESRKRPRQLRMNEVPGAFSAPTNKRPRTAHEQRSSILTPKAIPERQGQLEERQDVHQENFPQQAFHSNLLHMGHSPNFHLPNDGAAPMERFLAQSGDARVQESKDERGIPNAISEHRVKPHQNPPRHANALQTRIDCAVVQEPNFLVHRSYEPVACKENGRVAIEVDPFAHHYSIDFGISFLPAGVCFRSDTFVGSGEFHCALHSQGQTSSEMNGSVEIHYGDCDVLLGPWSEKTSEAFESCLQYACGLSDCKSSGSSLQSFTHTSSIILRRLISYFASYVSFRQEDDRLNCIALTLRVIDQCADNLLEISQERAWRTRLLIYLFVMSFQLLRLADHKNIAQETKDSVKLTLSKISNALAGKLIESDSAVVFHSPASISHARETGIDDSNVFVEATIVLYHSLKIFADPHLKFWKLIERKLLAHIPPDSDNIQDLEDVWHRLLALLPFIEVDAQGLLRPGSRKDSSNIAIADCGIAKELLSHTFTFVGLPRNKSNVNRYVRTVLLRCLNLIRLWGWSECESLLICACDFFRNRGLLGLPNEGHVGSAAFLERIHVEPTPVLHPTDNSFHIFLALLASGLIAMRVTHSETKIKNLAWRLMPNHGRTHKKEEQLQKQDLNALRNHHDLLVVLYYASPPNKRPSLNSIQNLVDFKSSHLEVCKLSVRAWANLVRYQLSTSEGRDCMKPFSLWIKDMVSKLTVQHNFARIEAQEIATDSNSFLLLNAMEKIVAKNQRAIEAVLRSLYAHLDALIKPCQARGASMYLFEESPRSELLHFPAFSNEAIIAGLRAYSSYVHKHVESCLFAKRLDCQDDSQDYGDIEMEDVPLEGESNVQWPLEQISDEVWSFFIRHADRCGQMDDACFTTAIDTYLQAANILVQRKRRDWTDYVDTHGTCSWHRLPQSDFKQKFGPFYFYVAIKRDSRVFEEHQEICLSLWFTSLVEEQSRMKYQHLLTEALLNAGNDHALLKNLPFRRCSSKDVHRISLEDLQLKRVNVISSVLSNIRHNYHQSIHRVDGGKNGLVRVWSPNLVRRLMATMKQNFLDIHPESSSRRAYVEFLQTVVQRLCEYTRNIQPVDDFFTQGADFPLPATDPDYNIGQLRLYTRSHGLAVEKRISGLIEFVRSISEYAVRHGWVDCLVGQLGESTKGSSEYLALRDHFLTFISPAYIRSSYSDCHLSFTAPMLNATRVMLRDMFSDVNLADRAQVRTLLHAVLRTVRSACSMIYDYPPSRDLTWDGVRTTTMFYQIVHASLPFLDYIARCPELDTLHSDVGTVLKYIHKIASAVFVQQSERDHGFEVSIADPIFVPADSDLHKQIIDGIHEELRSLPSEDFLQSTRKSHEEEKEEMWASIDALGNSLRGAGFSVQPVGLPHKPVDFLSDVMV